VLLLHALLTIFLSTPAVPAPALRQEPLPAGASTREGDWGQAHDGERGFGPKRSLRDLTRLLRSPAEEDRGFLKGLYGLEDEIRVLLSLVAERYKSAGYFELIEVADKEEKEETRIEEAQMSPLERLGEIFRERAAHAGTELPKGGRAADLLAYLLVDSRFRARAHVIDGLEFEIADMKAGLAVLGAELDGFAGLREEEAAAIARRVDLAASRVRAAKLDLEALREDSKDATAGVSWGKDLEELLQLIRTEDLERRARELPIVLDRIEQRELSMESALFTTRLEVKLAPEFEHRRQDLATAADLLKRVRARFPGTPEHEKAGPDVARQSKHQRYTAAAKEAAEALGYDPLGEELNWYAGEASDFLAGSIESRRYFDRYLALRGIRAHDHRTYQDRELSKEEKRALDVVQSVGGTPGSGPQPPQVPPPPK